MKVSQFRKLIREEVRRALNEDPRYDKPPLKNLAKRPAYMAARAAAQAKKAKRSGPSVGQTVTTTNLDPNTVYKVDIISSRGGFDPGLLKKVTNQGPPRAVALAVWRVAKEISFDDDSLDGSVQGYKLDEDTYYILVGEEDITIVGKLTSKKYGKFWSMLANGDLDGAEKLFNKMDADSANATDLASISFPNETKNYFL